MCPRLFAQVLRKRHLRLLRRAIKIVPQAASSEGGGVARQQHKGPCCPERTGELQCGSVCVSDKPGHRYSLRNRGEMCNIKSVELLALSERLAERSMITFCLDVLMTLRSSNTQQTGEPIRARPPTEPATLSVPRVIVQSVHEPFTYLIADARPKSLHGGDVIKAGRHLTGRSFLVVHEYHRSTRGEQEAARQGKFQQPPWPLHRASLWLGRLLYPTTPFFPNTEGQRSISES